MRLFRKKLPDFIIHDYEGSIPVAFHIGDMEIVKVPDGYSREQFDAFKLGWETARDRFGVVSSDTKETDNA